MHLMKIFLAFGLLSTMVACTKSSSDIAKVDLTEGSFITDSSNDCSSFDCQKLRKEFDYVVYTGKKIYCYWDLKKESTKNDFDQIAKDLKLSITDKTTKYDYYLILRKWAGSLQDGHVNAMWGEDNEALEELVVPLRLELLAPGTDHEMLIVAKTTPATKNIPVGSIVTKINGSEAMDRLNSIEKYISGSTSRMRRLGAARLIFSIMKTRKEEKSTVTIEYTFNGKTESVNVPRLVTLPVNVKKSDEAPIDFNSLVQVQLLPNNIGYLRIDGFSGDQEMFKLLERTMKLFEETSALIIDVRQNGGGDQSGNAILGHLIEQAVSRYHHRTRISDLLLLQREQDFISLEFNEGDEFTPYTNRSVKPLVPRYLGKVFVLTSPKCFSACDTFVSALKENNLATIVGEGTGGGTGTPYAFELNFSGLSFRYSVAQGLTAVNKQFLEGIGTLPDVEIFPTIEERIKGDDQQLLKTINLVAKEIGSSSVEKSVIEDLKKSPFVNKDSVGFSLRDEDNELKKTQLSELL